MLWRVYDFCDFIESGDVPCPKCKQQDRVGSLYVTNSDDHPKLRVECHSCDIVFNYFDLHGNK